MKYHAFVRPAAATLAAALALGLTGFASAQTTPPAVPAPLTSAPVVTDAGPPPAEDRNSHGAIVLDNSLPPLLQTNVMGAPPAKASKPAKLRKLPKSRTSQDGASNETLRLKGAGSLTEK